MAITPLFSTSIRYSRIFYSLISLALCLVMFRIFITSLTYDVGQELISKSDFYTGLITTGILSLVFFLVFLFFIYAFVNSIKSKTHFEANKQSTMGVIINFEKESDSIDTIARDVVIIRYMTKTGYYEKKLPISSIPKIGNLKKGDQIKVFYLPERPHIAEFSCISN